MTSGKPISIEFDYYAWQDISLALYREAGEIAASEARRTGGLGWASGGKQKQVERIHKIRAAINAKLDEDRKRPEVVQ